ncbi:MAG TPA: kinesin, partial [Cyanobacteria bacterium UBA9273]|nr:kinesin [Cyanobacteria bacterium UBA9273]
RLLGENHPDVAGSLNNLALLYKSQGRYSEAEPLYRQALAMRQELLGQRHPDVATSLNNLALLYQAKGDTTHAIEYLTQGTDIEESNLDTMIAIGSERQKQEYMATISGTTDRSISLHLQAVPNNPKALHLALTTLLRRKGRVLDAVTDNLQTLRQNLTLENQTLLDQLATTRSQLATLIFNKPKNLSLENYRNQVATLKAQADQLESELARRSAAFRSASQPATIASIQQQIPANTALIELALYKPFNPKATKPDEEWGTPRYVAYILHATGEPQWVDLGAAAPINQAVDNFRKALQNPNTDIKPIARTLDALLMQPIRPLLGNTRTLLISPDSQLNLISFAALVDENNHYLVENYSISYLSTGRDLLRLQNHAESRSQPLIIANPDYDHPGDPTSVSAAQLEELTSNNQRSLNANQLYFRPLPGTKAEAAGIIPLLTNPTLLEGTEATANALKQVFRPQILHIATHGFFLSNLPEVAPPAFGTTLLSDIPSAKVNVTLENPLLRSGLALAGANLQSSGKEDGILTALEAASLNLSGTKLVVLSGGGTGLGDVVNGEGVYGLRRAFTIAGAESQVMSLWTVSDKATKDIMVQYYQRLLNHEGRAEALRQIQLEFLKGNSYSHPYYWAVFILCGDWSPMEGGE